MTTETAQELFFSADGRLLERSDTEPYGSVPYADPGFQPDKKKRYPVDTKQHTQSAWSYINQAGNAAKYTAEQLAHIKAKIKSAAAQFGIDIEAKTANRPDFSARGRRNPLAQLRSYPAQFETRSLSNGKVEVIGYASTVGRAYDMRDAFGTYRESVRPGAFSKTLNEGADVSFLINHGGITLARSKNGTLTLREDAHGLLTTAQVNPNRSDARDMLTAIEDGDLTEMSFAFRVVQERWDDTYENRELIELNLDRGDVSVVNFGANPGTSILATQRALASIAPATLDRMQTELRSGQMTDATLQTLSQVLRCIADADVCLDQAQPMLADVLGVPNPDHDPTNGSDVPEPDTTEYTQADDMEQREMAYLTLLRLRDTLSDD